VSLGESVGVGDVDDGLPQPALGGVGVEGEGRLGHAQEGGQIGAEVAEAPRRLIEALLDRGNRPRRAPVLVGPLPAGGLAVLAGPASAALGEGPAAAGARIGPDHPAGRSGALGLLLVAFLHVTKRNQPL